MAAHAKSMEWLGYTGGLLTSSAILPQIYKSARYGATKDLSWIMLIIFEIGMILNVSFGFIINHPAVYFSALYSFTTNIIMILIKIYHEHYIPYVTELEKGKVSETLDDIPLIERENPVQIINIDDKK